MSNQNRIAEIINNEKYSHLTKLWLVAKEVGALHKGRIEILDKVVEIEFIWEDETHIYFHLDENATMSGLHSYYKNLIVS